MLPNLAATGHHNYTKSCRFYLEKIFDLKQRHEDVYEPFGRSLHVIRVSDYNWAGLSHDLVKEEQLMRRMKPSDT